MSVTVQRITTDEWQLLRDLRLESLRDSPAAFGQTYDNAAAQPDEEWRAMARAASSGTRRAWFVARDESGEAIGVVQARRRPPGDCLVFSMWVGPRARRSGAGSELVDAVERWAAGWGAQRIVLWVIGTNESAHRFYDRIGFRIIEDGPDAESGRAYGAFAMQRPVGSGGA